MTFSKNMSQLDRVIRFFAGLLLVGIAATFDLHLFVALLVGAFGLLNIFSAFIAHCPVYRAIGIASRAQSDEASFTNEVPRKQK